MREEAERSEGRTGRRGIAVSRKRDAAIESPAVDVGGKKPERVRQDAVLWTARAIDEGFDVCAPHPGREAAKSTGATLRRAGDGARRIDGSGIDQPHRRTKAECVRSNSAAAGRAGR